MEKEKKKIDWEKFSSDVKELEASRNRSIMDILASHERRLEMMRPMLGIHQGKREAVEEKTEAPEKRQIMIGIHIFNACLAGLACGMSFYSVLQKGVDVTLLLTLCGSFVGLIGMLIIIFCQEKSSS